MPPVRHILDFSNSRKAAALPTSRLVTHLVSQRLPNRYRSHDIRARRKELVRFHVWDCMADSVGFETVNKLTEPPCHWVNSQVTVRMPTPMAGKHLKEQWAR